MSGLPPLPRIDGDIDLMLDVYTHMSLRSPDTPLNDDYGDTLRLRELGQKVLELVVTYHLYNERPMLRQEEIQAKRDYILEHTNIDSWLKSYGLKEKLRAAPNVLSEVLNTPREMAEFFYIYVGALYTRNGLPTIQNWISQLIDPTANVMPPGAPAQSTLFEGAHYSQMNAQQGGYYTQPPHQQHNFAQPAYMTPPPPSANPPPLPLSPPQSTPSPFGHGPASTLSLVTLALVNQTAAQRGVAVTYPAEQTGPPHQPTWTVKCCMNGIERGRGSGKSQKIAKEEAARQAWAAMGWGPT